MILSQRQRRRIAETPITAPLAIPAPIKGWNTRDSLDAMDPLDAVTLDNFFPNAGGVDMRNGYTPFCTGLGLAPVETLAQYNSTTFNKFLAGCGAAIWDVTTGVGAVLRSGFSSNRWQTINFLSRLFLVNGQDTAQIYDGTTLTDAAFTGVTQSTLWGVWQFQQRLFFWRQNECGFWYAQLNSISGALAYYDLSAFCPEGGNLIAMTSSSYDGGNGVIDYATFITDAGDALLFQGNDPALAANWSMVGRYRISPPVSPRAVTNYGGDSFLTTFDDHVSLQQMFAALRLGSLPPRSKVSRAVQVAVQQGLTIFGWQALYYPRGRSLIFNIPNPDGTFSQHVSNTGLPDQPWCRFTNWDASCFGLFNNRLYFGSANGAINLADQGSLDGTEAIPATGQQAWNKLGNASRKRVATVRPIVQSVGAITYNFTIAFDYAPHDSDIVAIIVTPAIGSPWDTSPWDTSPWSAETTIDPRWRIGGGTGTAVGFGLQIAGTQPVTWLRTDLRVEGGSGL